MDNVSHSPRGRLHPLIATAAVTVIIASLALTAAITGVFTKASSTGAQTGSIQSASVAPQPMAGSAASPSTAPQPAAAQGSLPQQATVPQSATPSRQQAPRVPDRQYAQTQPSAPPQGAYAPRYSQSVCASCGTVESVVTVKHPGHGTGIGAVGGAVAGGVIGNQFGSGGGRTAMTLLGALGGGLGGNAVEQHMRSETDYEVRVRMQSGHLRVFTYRSAPQFQIGERVQVQNGTLTHAG